MVNNWTDKVAKRFRKVDEKHFYSHETKITHFDIYDEVLGVLSIIGFITSWHGWLIDV